MLIIHSSLMTWHKQEINLARKQRAQVFQDFEEASSSNLVQHLQETSGNAWALRSTDCFVQLVLWQWQFARSLSVQ